MKNVKQKGFTLIELLVVIAIIGILSTLAIVALNSARAKSRDSKRIADVKQIQTSLELFFNDKQTYPNGVSPVILGVTGTSDALCTSGFVAAPCPGGETTYMGSVPKAAIPEDGSCAPADNDFVFTTTLPTGSNAYSLTFCLGSLTGDLPGGPHTATQEGIQ